MSFNYAQLDSNNLVVCISSLSSKVDYSNMIEINDFYDELLGVSYVDGEFIKTEEIKDELGNVTGTITKKFNLETGEYETAI